MKIIANDILFHEVVEQIGEGRNVLLRLQGNSMSPLLVGGRDIVELTPPVSENVKKGAVVLFRHKGKYILHRIIAISGNRLIIMGDANTRAEHADMDDVVAVMCAVHRDGRIIGCDSRLWRLLSRLWMAVRPMRRIIMGVWRRVG